MSTEYRRGIPSTAHVEAATRLGLLWHRADFFLGHRTKFAILSDGDVGSDFGENPHDFRVGRIWDHERTYSYRPIRPDGTPVDWEVLDQEVVRVGQPGQPPGFRADLWRRMCQNFLDRDECELSLSMVEEFDGNEFFRFSNGNCLAITQDSRPGYTDADILARWTVYQELKPLYDLVDGAQGEAAMPRDVEVAWYSASVNERRRAVGSWILARDVSGLLIKNNRNTVNWRKDEPNLGAPLRNFAAVLDAVAERRVTAAAIYSPTGNREGAVAPPIQAPQRVNVEPRRFADVRPDRHGWRWWRMWGSGCIPTGSSIECQPGLGWRMKSNSMYTFDWNVPNSSDADRTIIPTDEQGNPVSWETAGHIAPAGTVQSVNSDGTVTVHLNGDGSVSPTREGEAGTIHARWAAPEGFYMPVPSTSFFSTEPPTPPRLSQFSNNPATPPLTPEGFQRVLVGAVIGVDTAKAPPITTLPLPLPRFTTDELDDVDHSKTTKLDEVTLRRGKLPTVEQIAKYREVRAKRTGGSVADALKESRIDCEVAQYVLERWAGGLGDANVLAVVEEVRFLDCAVDVDKRASWFINLMRGALDTAEKSSPTTQREQQEAEERRQRLAELRQQLAAERTAQPQEMAKESVSRFDLIEPDPQADPAASIRAWEARQAAAKVRPTATLPHIAKPAAAPRRPAIEVVDAEVDGLSRSEAFAALFGRALNGGC